MPIFAANITTMFNEVPELERLRKAKQAGFDYVEWLFPYKYSVSEINSHLQRNQLNLVLMNTGMGDPENGDRGIGCLPGRETDFKRAFEEAFGYAETLGVPLLHVMAGQVPDGITGEECIDTFVSNLNWAVSIAKGTDTDLLIEPLNRRDTPRYLHANCAESMNIISRLDNKVGLQFDFYHLQVMEGDLAFKIEKYFRFIKHIQFSSVPGRFEPRYGEVNVDYLFNRLDKLGYNGYVGCEYKAKTTTEEGLSWAIPWGIRPRW